MQETHQQNLNPLLFHTEVAGIEVFWISSEFFIILFAGYKFPIDWR